MSKPGAAEAKGRRGRRPGPSGPTVNGGSQDARRLAAVLLEVLAGQRSPTDAAAQVGVSVPRYYALESRALEGLVAACEPRRRGRQQSPEREAGQLRAELERLQRTCARSQALLRLSQRAIGVSASERPSGSKGKRPRRPVARGLAAAAKLAIEAGPLPEEANDAKTK